VSAQRQATAQAWAAYFDALDAALRGVALAVADGAPPPWPSGLSVPPGPVPVHLLSRKEAGVRAIRAVFDVTGAARDAVAGEISRIARASAGRQIGSGRASAAVLGGRFDAVG